MNNLFKNNAFDVMRDKNFRLFLSYRFFLTMATLMQSVVVSWQLYNLTKNVFSLGLIGLVEVIPQVSIALFAGHFLDIWDRRKIIINTSVLLLVGSAILLAYSIPSLHGFALFGTLPIFITIFLTGFVRGILMPAHTALLGQLVTREKLAKAATWNSASWHIAAVLGPAIGGLIYGFFGIIAAYSTVFVFFLISIVLIISTKKMGKVVLEKKTDEGIFVSIKEGIRFVFKSEMLLGAFSLDMFAVLFGGAVAMLPAFASDILKVGPEGLGFLRSCPAIGAILMSFILMVRLPEHKTGTYLLWAVVGFGLCMIGFALSTNFYFSALLLFLSGVFDNVSVVIRSTILQLYTPNEMRGRVAAVNSIFIGSSNELGAFESGSAARFMGLVPSVVFGGVMTLVVVGFAAKMAPGIRKLSLK
jgi:MFS family permease